jgi:hypothetical protein
MKLEYRIALFVFLILLEAYFDPYIKQCDSLYGKFLMLFHHFSVIFAVLFSVLFGYHLIHFIVVLFMTLMFVKNDGCILTFYHNRVCGNDSKKEFPSWITYIYETINVNNKLVLCSIHSIILLYDLYMIFFIKKNLSLLT